MTYSRRLPYVTDNSDLDAHVLPHAYVVVDNEGNIRVGDGTSVGGRRLRPIFRNYITDIPGVVEGVVSSAQRTINRQAINAELAAGTVLSWRPGSYVEIDQSLLPTSGSGLTFERGGTTPILFMPAANFTNTGLDAVSRYAANAVAINCSGMKAGPYTPNSDIVLENFAIQSETTQGRNLRGIVGQNVSNLQIGGIEVFGIPMGIGICVASIVGNSWINDCFVHDFFDNTTGWGSAPQATGIEVDNDRVNSIASVALQIRNPKIRSIVLGAAAIAAYGYQTDGINIVHHTTVRTKITGFDIDTVGEGIDCFGSYGVIGEGVVKNAYNYGIKLIHGASHNQGSNINIQSAGLAGLDFESSNDVDGDTAYNSFSGVTISDMDPNDVWAANATACVRMTQDGAVQKVIGNTVNGAFLSQGKAKYGWLDVSGAGNGNIGEALRIIAGVNNDKRVYCQNAGNSVSLVGALQTRVTSLV